MIYLASPYSHPDPAVRNERYQAACRTTAALLKAGLVVFSPIVHSHPLVEFELPTGWDFWQQIDRQMLMRCDAVVVLMLDGWRESTGVRAEIALARVLLPVRAFYLWGGYANCANYPPVLKACGLYFSQAIIWVKEHPVPTLKDGRVSRLERVGFAWERGRMQEV